MKKRQKIALDVFYDGKNCAQSILMAYSNMLDFDTEQALNMASGFGGGMGKLQKTCGAISGAVMVIGLRQAVKIPDEKKRKQVLQEMVQEFFKRFVRINHSDQCADLLKIDFMSPEGTEDFYKYDLKEKVCSKCLNSTIEILDSLFEE